MKIKTQFLGLTYIISLLITSCSPTYYLPTKQNVLVFEEKGDAFVTVNLATDGLKGLEGGYAFTDNIGVYSSFNSFDISIYGNSNQFIKDFCWDNELVLYKRYASGLYAGVNIGAGIGAFNVNNPYYDLKLNRQFIQPSIGMRGFPRIDYLDLAVSCRFSRLNYNAQFPNNNSNYDIEMSRIYFELTDVMSDKEYYFYEPAISLGFRYEFFKLNFQYALAIKTGHEKYFYQRESISTSLSLNIDKLFFNRMDKTKKLSWSF